MTRLLNVVGLLAASLFVNAGSAVEAQKPELLRYKMDQKQPLIYRSSANFKQVQTIRKMKIETIMNSTQINIRTLKKYDNSKNLELQTEIKAINVKMKIGPLGEYTYDSKSDENEKGSTLGTSLTPIFDTLNGATLTVIHSPRGELVEVKGYAELLAEVLKDNSFGKQLINNGSNNSHKFSLTEIYPIMKKEPVRLGDTWEEPFEMVMPKIGTAKGTRKYKFVGYDMVGKTKTAKITYTTDLTFKLDLNQGGQKVTGDLSIEKSSATVHFDPKMGRVVKVNSTFTLAGDISVSVNGNDITIGTQQAHTIALELLEKLPK